MFQSGASHFGYTTGFACFQGAYSLSDNQLGLHWMGTDNGVGIYGGNKSAYGIIGFNILVNSYISVSFYGIHSPGTNLFRTAY